MPALMITLIAAIAIDIADSLIFSWPFSPRCRHSRIYADYTE